MDNQPNVLFIMVDDLRVELGSYGGKHVLSPNIDKLAQQGIQFENAYVSVPVCGASRASLFTGMRALPDRFVTYYSSVEKDAPNATTIFEQFKENGYETISYGKIFHNIQDTAEKSWSSGQAWVADYDQKPELLTQWRDYQLSENIAEFKSTGKGPSTEIIDGPDESYFDGKVAVKAMNKLEQLSKLKKPFFLSVGFVKPHLPFTAPKEYWDMYDPQQFIISKNELPDQAPKQAWHHFGELRAYSDIPASPALIGSKKARQLIHGYHAGVSYADAQVGKVLAKLDALELRDNTIVVLMGDHGYSLGEHSLWAKHSTFDISTRTPLIISAPNMPINQTVSGLVEFIDIFPTLTDLAGIEPHKQASGMSLVPQLKDHSAPTKSAVFIRYHNAEAIHSDQYSLTQWYDDDNKYVAQMLYDNKNDPDEARNLANLPKYQKVLDDLSNKLALHMKTRN
ncbi:MAG: sulfatase [Alteromonadales bacterium]|nr:sulfatase [Alteromonadales bacterium]